MLNILSLLFHFILSFVKIVLKLLRWARPLLIPVVCIALIYFLLCFLPRTRIYRIIQDHLYEMANKFSRACIREFYQFKRAKKEKQKNLQEEESNEERKDNKD